MQDSLSSVAPEEASLDSSVSSFDWNDLRLDKSISGVHLSHVEDPDDVPIPSTIECIDFKRVDRLRNYATYVSLDECLEAIYRGEESPIPIHEHPQVMHEM